MYDKIVPDQVEQALSRVFHNAGIIPRLPNNVLQGKLKGAGIELSRFVLNKTVGIGGSFDVAKPVFELETPSRRYRTDPRRLG